ncbi:MAG: M20/M25/M40 family metallo-hydrolase, partial [Planctomycetota bacterium]
QPAAPDGSWFHEFTFPAGAKLTEENDLKIADESFADSIQKQWQPLAFSASGNFRPLPVVFAGYGMTVPETKDAQGKTVDEYDSYVHLDVKDKWVMVLRDLPQEISTERRQQLARFSSPRRKAANARDHGAAGIIFVSGPTSKVRNQLVRFERDASQSGISIPVISINNRLAVRLMQAAERDLGKEQSKIDDGEMAMGFLLEGATVSANIAIERKTGTGRNVIGRLPANDAPMGANPVVMVGAHIDHLGVGGGSSSLARDEERDRVHVGADDNASGVAAMLEIAQGLAQDIRQGTIQPKRDLVVAAWSGEELGLYGSKAFVGEYLDRYPRSIDLMMGIRPQEDAGSQPESPADDATSLEPNAASPEPGAAPPIANESGLTVGDIVAAHGMDPDALPLTGLVSAYLNLDMVGRLEEKLIVQGTGSSPAWEPLVQRRNVPVGLQLRLDPSAARLPTDAASFVAREVPILAAFTGVHEDYHTPRDTPEKLNYEGAAKIARLFALIARDVLTSDTPPNFE